MGPYPEPDEPATIPFQGHPKPLFVSYCFACTSQWVLAVFFYPTSEATGTEFHSPFPSCFLYNPKFWLADCSATCFHDGFLLGSFFDSEDGDNMFLQNVGWHSMDYIALYPTPVRTSNPTWKHMYLHFILQISPTAAVNYDHTFWITLVQPKIRRINSTDAITILSNFQNTKTQAT
jgi:hypothetical protein